MTEALRIDPAPQLPIAAVAGRIAEALEQHQVIVVSGATGSGKTTQLPKICLRAGRRRIAHTQPRRIAARSVAERLAAELGTTIGQYVGYQVRFTRKATVATRVKIMTDGVLLAEISGDRDLRRYDTIIIDEAHERSLNIDFLLGYLKQLLPRRPELKVIITSATIDTQRFSRHFDDAPVIEVPGRTFPVEIRYRPLSGGDLVDGVAESVLELWTEAEGDTLVFLPGERDILDVAEALAGLKLPNTEIVPLFARLSLAEQQRVFAPHEGTRIVLATNVAETSITVPGIRAVVDTGLARISRYSARTKVQRLPIEEISQASAWQRAGRCGRVGPGTCIRLYSEEEFLARPEFTEPEILRTNLAQVILKMAEARLGDIERFPFVEAPDRAQVRDGMRLLRELGALAEQESSGRHSTVPMSGRRRHGSGIRLTRIGRLMSQIPVDPRLARMLVEADERGCLAEVQVIVAGLSVPDVREFPVAHREAAEAAHRRFWASQSDDAGTPDGSDIVALLRLWDYLVRQQQDLSGNAFRRLCRDEYLNFLRVREWQDLQTQIRQACRELGMKPAGSPAELRQIHTSVLSGLLSHVGLLQVREKTSKGRRVPQREYLGARGATFMINPGSSVAKEPPELVMAVELVETTRLWARIVAPVDAEQVEAVGGHMLKKTYSEPHWSIHGGQAVATEKVSLLGVPIITDRLVSYGRIDPVVARQIFIQSALVEGRWHTRHHFFTRNQRTRDSVAELENRTRRRDLLVDDQVIYDFYDRRIPADVVSVAHFDRWWRDFRRNHETDLDLGLSDLIAGDGEAPMFADFPDNWSVAGVALPVTYRYDPGASQDGVSVHIDVAVLNQVNPEPFTWQVPGLREELATALIRSLPKSLRTHLVPAPQMAQRALAWLAQQPLAGDFRTALGTALQQVTGVAIAPDDFDPARLPPHLQIHFVVQSGGEVLARGDDPAELAVQLRPVVLETLNAAASEFRHPGASQWIFGEIPEVTGKTAVKGYPALRDQGDRVAVVILDDRALAEISHRNGLRRLLALTTVDTSAWVKRQLDQRERLTLGASPYPTVPAVIADARLAAIDRAMDAVAEAGGVRLWQVRTTEAFARLADQVRSQTADLHLAVMRTVVGILAKSQEVQRLLPSAADADVADDLQEQLNNLIFPGFISATPAERLPHLDRYCAAMCQRMRSLTTHPTRDEQQRIVIADVEDAYAMACALFPEGPLPKAVADIGWLIEELRVSLFAQQLKTSVPVSVKRVQAAIAALPRGR